MKKSLSKVLSMILITVMVISSVPMSSFAANILCNLGHDWGTYTVTTPATCSTKGVEQVVQEMVAMQQTQEKSQQLLQLIRKFLYRRLILPAIRMVTKQV